MRIKDNFRVNGTDFDTFRAENKAMEDMTKEIVVRGADIQLLSHCTIPTYQKEDRVAVSMLTPETIDSFLTTGTYPRGGYIPNVYFGNQEVIDEMVKTTGLCFTIGDDLYVVSELAIPTLTLRAEVKGDMTIQRSNLLRDMHVADALFDKNEKIHLIYRTEELGGRTVRKVFACLGSAYKLIPQTILAKTIDSLSKAGTIGRVEMSSFEIDHLYTTCQVELPEIGEEIASEYKTGSDIVPGLYISTSDVGASSVIIRGTYRHGRSYVVTDEVMMKHAGDITPEKILAEADASIFSKIRKLPETLAVLIGREATDYSELDLTSEDGAAKNMEAISGILESEVKYVCKEAKVSGKKRDQLLECMVSEINTGIPYTLYDIAINFMGIPERIEGLDRDTITRLRKACGQVPYRLEKRPVNLKKDDDVVLLPE